MRLGSVLGALSVCLLASCASIVPKEARTEVIGGFDSVEHQQQKPVWCWAACASMIHEFNGTPMSQKEIAERIHGYGEEGELKVAAASRFEVYKALSPNSTALSFDQIWEVIEEQVEAEAAAAVDRLKEGELTTGVSVDVDPMVGVHAGLDRYFPIKATPLEALAENQPAVVGLKGVAGGAQGHLCVIVGAEWMDAPEWAKDLDEIAGSVAKKGGIVSDSELENWSQSTAVAVEASARFNMDQNDVKWIEIVDPWIEDDKTTEVNEMRTRLSLGVVLAASSCASTGEQAMDFGGNPVPVEIEVVAVRENPSSASVRDGFPVQAWVLNTAGMLSIGGRDQLTDYGTLVEQGPEAEAKAMRAGLVGKLNKEALHTITWSLETVSIEPKLHTLVVVDGLRLRHELIDVIRLDAPYKFRLQL